MTGSRPADPIPVGARNPRLQRLRKLVRQSKARADHGVFVVDGPVLVAEALTSALQVRELFTSVGTAPLLAEMPVGAEVDLYSVEESVLTSVLDPVSPRPLAAVVEAPSWTIDHLPEGGPVLVAAELQDPGNLGTMVRTAEAAGFGGVVVAGPSVDRWSPKVVRASAGSVLRLPVVRVEDAAEVVARLSGRGWETVAAVVDADVDHYDRIDLTGAAILVGGEANGLPPALSAAADRSVTIPMSDRIDSINVAAAAAVLCFEAARQRRVGAPG